MKQFVLFTVIAGLLALSNGAAVKSSDTGIILVTTDGVSNGEGLLRQYPAPLQRAGEVLLLSQGIIGTPEQRVYGIILEYDFPNLIHVDVSYDGSRPITGIRVSEIGNNPHTTAALIGGGLGQTFASVRVAAPGSGKFFVTIDIWA